VALLATLEITVIHHMEDCEIGEWMLEGTWR
jgi:hypothetical protein